MGDRLVAVRVHLHRYLDSCGTVLTTLSAESLNRDLVCAAHIPIKHGLDPDAHVLDGRVSVTYICVPSMQNLQGRNVTT